MNYKAGQYANEVQMKSASSRPAILQSKPTTLLQDAVKQGRRHCWNESLGSVAPFLLPKAGLGTSEPLSMACQLASCQCWSEIHSALAGRPL